MIKSDTVESIAIDGKNIDNQHSVVDAFDIYL
jgi:hypothetical protein